MKGNVTSIHTLQSHISILIKKTVNSDIEKVMHVYICERICSSFSAVIKANGNTGCEGFRGAVKERPCQYKSTTPAAKRQYCQHKERISTAATLYGRLLLQSFTRILGPGFKSVKSREAKIYSVL